MPWRPAQGRAIGLDPVNLWIESREVGEDGTSIRFSMRNESNGFGTRVAAWQMRTLVANVLANTDGCVAGFRVVGTGRQLHA